MSTSTYLGFSLRHTTHTSSCPCGRAGFQTGLRNGWHDLSSAAGERALKPGFERASPLGPRPQEGEAGDLVLRPVSNALLRASAKAVAGLQTWLKHMGLEVQPRPLCHPVQAGSEVPGALACCQRLVRRDGLGPKPCTMWYW